MGPSVILHEEVEARLTGRLTGERAGRLPKAEPRREKHPPHEIEPIQGIESTAHGRVTVSPFVVTRNVDEWVREALEAIQNDGVGLVIAGGHPIFGVAHMNAEGRGEFVGGGDDVFETVRIRRHVIGHATHDEKLEGFIVFRSVER